MVKAGDYKINEIYQGGPSSLNPPSDNSITAGSLGLTTDPRSANILKEVSSKLSTGVKQIELEFVSPEVFDSIPKQQLTEVRRLSKLTGVGLSVHGPVMDTTGITQQGFSELGREASEKRIIQTIERSHELDPQGNIVVNFHSAEGIPGTEWKTLGENGKEREAKKLIVVDRETGKLAPLEEEKKFYPGEEKARKSIRNPKKVLADLNNTEWGNSLSQIEFNREHAERILKDTHPIFIDKYLKLMKNELSTTGSKESEQPKISSEEYEKIKEIHAAQEYLKQAEMNANALFNKAYKYGTSEKKEALDEISKQYGKLLGMKDDKRTIQSFDPKKQSDAMYFLTKSLQRVQPEMHVPVEEFATEQSSKTFGNAAFEAYERFKDNAPIISIENPPAGFALSTGEDLKNLAEKSREHFVERLVQEKNKSKKAAERIAERLIGVTWDVGHINMLRKQGFGEEGIIKETEKIAPFIKHVHLSDNFGFEHTELPMGMGNVPLKKIMDKLGEKGFEAKKIIEAAGWWQHFKTPPVQETMEALGSPMGATAPGLYWNQAVGLQQGYSSGYGQMLPDINYQTFGAGFLQLPVELGGQVKGAQGGRMSGNPME